MGTLWLLIAHFVLKFDAITVANYQVLAFTLPLDLISILLLLKLRKTA